VLHGAYMVFNEGYTAASADELHRTETVRRRRSGWPGLRTGLLPDDGRGQPALLALMLLTGTQRRQARGAITRGEN